MLKFLAGFTTCVVFLVCIMYFAPICCFHDAMGEAEQLRRLHRATTITVGFDPELKPTWMLRGGGQGAGYLGGNRIIVLMKDEAEYDKTIAEINKKIRRN